MRGADYSGVMSPTAFKVVAAGENPAAWEEWLRRYIHEAALNRGFPGPDEGSPRMVVIFPASTYWTVKEHLRAVAESWGWRARLTGAPTQTLELSCR